MNKLLVNRIYLIKALQASINKVILNDAEGVVMKNIITTIRKDTDTFLSLSQDNVGWVSYAKNVADKLNSKRRIKTTLARFIRRQLNITPELLCDSTLDKLNIEAKINMINYDALCKRIEILKGQDIVSFYERNREAHSCMTEENAYLVSMYALNPSKVSLVVLDNTTRALLWTTDNEVKVLDRVYPAGCHGVYLIRYWAKENGCVLRSSPDRQNTSGLLSDNGKYKITMRHNNVFPYLDTFCYATNKSNNNIVISNDPSIGEYILVDTDGSLDFNIICSNCGCEMSDEDTYDDGGNMYCESCFNEIMFICDNCDNYASRDDEYTYNSSTYCYYCYCQKIFTCDRCKYDFLRAEINLYNGRELCKSCIKHCSILKFAVPD